VKNRIPATTHATHDELLLARLYGDDVTAAERARALDQMSACVQCTDFFADLGSIAAALPALPVPARPRDFSLTEADAARLRRGGFGAVLGLVGRARTFGRAMVAAGLVGVVVLGAVSAFLPGSGGSGRYSAYDNGHGSTVGVAAGPGTNGSAPEYAASVGPVTLSSSGMKAGGTAGDVAVTSAAPTLAALVSEAVPSARPVASSCGGGAVCDSGGLAVAEPSMTPRPVGPPQAEVAGGPDLRLAALAGFAGLLLLGLLVLLWTRLAARRAGR
jgi:hypothetical protein